MVRIYQYSLQAEIEANLNVNIVSKPFLNVLQKCISTFPYEY